MWNFSRKNVYSIRLLDLSKSSIPFTGLVVLLDKILVSTIYDLILSYNCFLSHVSGTQELDRIMEEKYKSYYFMFLILVWIFIIFCSNIINGNLKAYHGAVLEIIWTWKHLGNNGREKVWETANTLTFRLSEISGSSSARARCSLARFLFSIAAFLFRKKNQRNKGIAKKEPA